MPSACFVYLLVQSPMHEVRRLDSAHRFPITPRMKHSAKGAVPALHMLLSCLHTHLTLTHTMLTGLHRMLSR